MKPIIETHELTKTYGNFTAVYRLNLHIRKGTVYGFLGPNGAGKSTTMKMFLGLVSPTVGTFTIEGWPTPGTGWRSCEGPAPSSRSPPSTAI